MCTVQGLTIQQSFLPNFRSAFVQYMYSTKLPENNCPGSEFSVNNWAMWAWNFLEGEQLGDVGMERFRM